VIWPNLRNVFGDSRRIAGQFQRSRIERMGHERSLVDVEQIARRGVGDTTYGPKENLRFL
jgi:hypothetical protein